MAVHSVSACGARTATTKPFAVWMQLPLRILSVTVSDHCLQQACAFGPHPIHSSYDGTVSDGASAFGAASSSATLMFAVLRRRPPAMRSSSASSRVGMKSLGMRAIRSGVNHTGFAWFHARYLQHPT